MERILPMIEPKMSKCSCSRGINCLRWKTSSNFTLSTTMKRFLDRLESMLRSGCYHLMIQETPRDNKCRRCSWKRIVLARRGMPPSNTEAAWRPRRIIKILSLGARFSGSSSRWTLGAISIRILKSRLGSKRCRSWNCNLTVGLQVEAKPRSIVGYQ